MVYHASDSETRKVFEELNMKTVPYICTSKQEAKREPDAEFYRSEDMWLIKPDVTHDTQV